MFTISSKCEGARYLVFIDDISIIGDDLRYVGATVF